MRNVVASAAELLAEVTGLSNDLSVARWRAHNAERRALGLEQQVEHLQRKVTELNARIDEQDEEYRELGEKAYDC